MDRWTDGWRQIDQRTGGRQTRQAYIYRVIHGGDDAKLIITTTTTVLSTLFNKASINVHVYVINWTALFAI